MKIVAIVQARLGSKRFPKKIFQKINNMPLIEILMKRVLQVDELDKVVLATSDRETDKPLFDFANQLGYEIFNDFVAFCSISRSKSNYQRQGCIHYLCDHIRDNSESICI